MPPHVTALSVLSIHYCIPLSLFVLRSESFPLTRLPIDPTRLGLRPFWPKEAEAKRDVMSDGCGHIGEHAAPVFLRRPSASSPQLCVSFPPLVLQPWQL